MSKSHFVVPLHIATANHGRTARAHLLKRLRAFDNFKFLGQANTQITDAALQELHDLPTLQIIDLHKTNVSDEAVEELQKALPECEIER